MVESSLQGTPKNARLVVRLSENAHLLRYPYPSSLRRTSTYASFLGICPRFAWTPRPAGGSPVSEAPVLGAGSTTERDFAKLNLHLDIFHQPLRNLFFDSLGCNLQSYAKRSICHFSGNGETYLP